MNAKEAIQARARELGFDACRFTTAEPPASAPRLREWLNLQRHGDMAWLARNADKRAEPQRVLPGARTIVALAVAYGDATCSIPAPAPGLNLGAATFQSPQTGSGDARNVAPPMSGFIARYARHADYHDVLATPLKSLTAFVNELGGPGTKSLWYADTGPLLERDLAQRAGLGFVGKHTNLISRSRGNWILLAEILTTLELAPDPPEKNRCGSCVRCIAACPTEAIVAPFQLDARLCLSYLTIEAKGAIPVELRPALGNRVFGCDDCLAACPWNRFAQEGRLMREAARVELAVPDLLELLALDEAGFRARFAGTPIFRAKRRGLLRNVGVALGNVGDERALPALAKAAGDLEPLVAEHARWAREQIGRRAVATAR